MMLWRKAWLESRARFALSACALAALCVAFVVFHREGAVVAERSQSYIEYIWRIVYKGYLREMFVLLAVLLGVGGLMRERDYGTAGFTLALPISRRSLILTRAAVGLVEVAVLSLAPALILPSMSSFVGEVYPWSQALQFGLLWCIAGAFLFGIGFLVSIFFSGEYTAAVVAVIVVLGYSLTADLPLLGRFVFDVHDVMSGVNMAYFRPDVYLLAGPLPWFTLGIILLVVCCFLMLAVQVTKRQDF